MTEATEGPWKWHPKSSDQEHNGSIYSEPRAGHAYAIAMQPRYVSDEQWADDAELIVRAVNAIRSAARTGPGVAGLREALNSATLSCSGTEITIQCAGHVVKDAIFDGLESIAALPAPAGVEVTEVDLVPVMLGTCKQIWKDEAQKISRALLSRFTILAKPAQERREEIARIIENELCALDLGCGDEVNMRDCIAHFRQDGCLENANDLIGDFSAWCADAILALPPAPKGEPSQEVIAKLTEIHVLDSHGRYGRLAKEVLDALRREPEGER